MTEKVKKESPQDRLQQQLDALREDQLDDWADHPVTKLLWELCRAQEGYFNLARYNALEIGEAQKTQENRCVFLGQAAAYQAVRTAIEEKSLQIIYMPGAMESDDDGEQIGNIPGGRQGAH